MMMPSPPPPFAPSPGRLGGGIVAPSPPPPPPPAFHPPPPPLLVPPPPAPPRSLPRSTPLMSLPPHRRAQVLLQEMAGLTSRLMELAGSKTWQATLGKSSAHAFLAGVLPPEGATATTTKEVLSLIESHQSVLFEAIGEITELQEIEQEKQRIAESIAAKDAVLRDFAKRLRDAEQVLEYTMEDYEEYQKPKRVMQGDAGSSQGAVGLGSIDLKEIIAYAHRISYTTFAPPEFASGQIPLRGAFPPAPQEEQMRASQLYHVSDADIGLPKPSTATVSPVGINEAHVEAGRVIADNSQVSAALRAGLPLPPPIPSGWRPGIPIELPADLPPMPPGWKPGDPIPLPSDLDIPLPPPGWTPGDAIFVGSLIASRPQEQAIPAKTAALATPVPPPPPGVIQVPFVQLDLNPELEEDYGSDYSDEDGSSEEDED